MARKFLVNIDLNGNQLLNTKLQVLATDPTLQTGDEARIWYNSTNKRLKYWDGSQVIDVTDALTLQGQNGAYYLSRANHTGTQTASTISDFNAAVQANRLDQMAVPQADLNLNAKKITNLGAPAAANDAATKAYVDAVKVGLDVKESVRAATTANITLSGTQTVDGVALDANDRVLVKNQTSGAENGIYVVATGAWSRASDADSSDEVTSGMFCFVEEGTENADTGWVLTTNAPITLGTTALNFAQFSGQGTIEAGDGLSKTGNTLNVNVDNSTIEISADTLRLKDSGISTEKISNGAVTQQKIATGAVGTTQIADSAVTDEKVASGISVDKISGAVKKYAATIGDGTATSFTITHNLNTQDVIVQVRETASPYAYVDADVEATTVNTATVRFAVAPSTNQYRVIITG